MNLFKKTALAIITLGFIACEPIEKVGPDICAGEKSILAKEDIHLFRVSSDSIQKISEGDVIQLDTSGLKIEADFGHELFWDLKISDGALEKNYSGKDSSINILLYGQPDKFDGTNLSIPEGEVTVELRIVCQDDPIIKKINLKGQQKFKGIDPSFGVLIRDYDKNGVVPVKGDNYSFFDGAPQWSTNNIKDSNRVEYSNIEPSPSGGNYIIFEAEQEELSWYFGIYQLKIKDYISLLPDYSAENVYLNFFVKRSGDLLNVPANVGFRLSGSNLMLFNEEINWDGWKLVSIPLSDLRDTNTEDPLTDLRSIDWLSVNLGSFPLQSSKTGISYDMFLITIGKPLFE
jgi:hypothetical protein